MHEAGLVDFWSLFVPLLLILIGVLKLAERAALAAAGDEPPYPGSPYPYGAAASPGGRGRCATAARHSRLFLRRRTMGRVLREGSHEQRTSEHAARAVTIRARNGGCIANSKGLRGAPSAMPGKRSSTRTKRSISTHTGRAFLLLWDQ